LGNTNKSNCDFVSDLQIPGVGGSDENVKLFPMSTQNQADFLNVSIWLRLSLLQWCPEFLMFQLKGRRNFVPVNPANI